MQRYWVISEKTNYKEEDGLRWITFPATDETLQDVKKIVELFDSKVYVAIEVEQSIETKTTEYWKSLPLTEQLHLMTIARDSLQKRVSKAEDDCRILALRLCGEDEATFAPETQEVMARWKPRVLEEDIQEEEQTNE